MRRSLREKKKKCRVNNQILRGFVRFCRRDLGRSNNHRSPRNFQWACHQNVTLIRLLA